LLEYEEMRRAIKMSLITRYIFAVKSKLPFKYVGLDPFYSSHPRYKSQRVPSVEV
jgi:hypothetical protein